MTMETIQELAAGDTVSTDVRGSSRTAYALEPTVWLKEINDAAQKKHYFKQFVYETTVAKGNKDVIIPKRLYYLRPTDWQATAGQGVAVNYTKLDNLDGVRIEPVPANGGVAIPNYALQINAIDLIKAAKDELTYRVGDEVDIAVATAFKTATPSTSTASGAQTIYGGKARADSELTTGDIFDVDMIADAKTKLQSTTCKYWTPLTPADEAVSSAKKNPWANETGDPFVLFISSQQENVLLKDSQFTNAAEYGNNEVIMNGEIGKYLGIKVVVTENTPSFSAGAEGPDGSTATVAGHRCILAKPKKAVALAWGIKPNITVEDFRSELEKRVILEMAYGTGVIHSDAIVFIDVADN
jgi:N4-gp56 family major capsid protein